MATTPAISSRSWEDHKPEILRLYLDEEYPLKLVMKRLRRDDFDPTESQYRTKLKKWKQRKPRNTRSRRQRSSATTEASSSHPPGDDQRSPKVLTAPAFGGGLDATTYQDQIASVPSPAEDDPPIRQLYRENQLQADVPQSAPFRWSPQFDTISTPENEWALIPVDKDLSDYEDTQSLRVSSAWRRASQANSSQACVYRDARVRQCSYDGEKRGSAAHPRATANVSSDKPPVQEGIPIVHPEYHPVTHTPNQEHQSQYHSTPITHGPVQEHQSGYHSISTTHIQEQQPGCGPPVPTPIENYQPEAYYTSGPYEGWSWPGTP